MNTTLVIMAAGIGSRYGGGIKQLAHVGSDNEIIMDYSIYDALSAGFDKIVFVIRRAIEKDFREIIGDRVSKYCKTEYVFQEFTDLPDGFSCSPDRKKPWGTGHAILSCKSVINEPFAVINADDFYGAGSFGIMHDFLVSNGSEVQGKENICLAGYILKNTLSENGTVTRGICSVDGESRLVSVSETSDIERLGGTVYGTSPDGQRIVLDEDNYASMNMWGLYPPFLEKLEEGFRSFLSGIPENDTKSEFLLPGFIDTLIKDGRAQAKLLPTDEKWFGITYKEDLPKVQESIRKLCENGVYPESIERALTKA